MPANSRWDLIRRLRVKSFRLVNPFTLATMSSYKREVFIVQALKAYGTLDLQFFSFLTSTAVAGERAASRLPALPPGK